MFGGLKMTEYHILQSLKRYEIEDYRCFFTGKTAIQNAHRIPRTKMYLKKYGSEIINHNINLVPVLNLEYNSKINVGNKPVTIEKIAQFIKDNKDKDLTAREINNSLGLSYEK